MSEHSGGTDEVPTGKSRGGRVFDAGEQPIAEAVIEATAAATDTDPLDMEPLFGVVDPDALETLVAGPANGDSVSVSFEFEGRQVTVQRGGRIHIGDE